MRIILRNYFGVVALLLMVSCGGGGGDTPSPTPTLPTLSIADSSVAEGNNGDTTDMPFIVSLSEAATNDITVGYSTNAVTTNTQDFDLVTGTVTIPAGSSEATVIVTVNGDEFYETDETLTVNLENLPASVTAGDLEAFGTIRTDDLPTISFQPQEVEINEGDTDPRTIIFDIELAGITNEISVDYATSDSSATVADNDYTPVSGTLVIPAGATTATIEVEVLGDTNPENLIEEFRIALTNVVGDAVLHPVFSTAVGRIIDNDTPIVVEPAVYGIPTFSAEGDSGTTTMNVVISLNTTLTSRVTLDYATRNSSAEAGSDYVATNGRLFIQAGETQAIIPVNINGDTDVEGLEEFFIDLTLLSNNVKLLTPTIVCSISGDDSVGPPSVKVQRSIFFEGDTGTRNQEFVITLSRPASEVISVDYATRDITALAGSDYDAVNGTVSFNVGETVKFFTVPILGDTVIEADENFEIDLSNLNGNATLFQDNLDDLEGEIRTDDPFALVSISDVGLLEGNAGTSDLVFTVSIDAVAGDPVTMDFTTADPTSGHIATANQDYVAVNSSISIPAGQTQATVTVQLNGDTDNEFDEIFNIVLSNVSQNAEFAKAIGTGRLINDDGTPGWQAPQRLNQEGQDNVLPKVTMNANGDAMAVWAPKANAQSVSLQYESNAYSLATGWGPLERPSADTIVGFSRTDRDLFIDNNGRTTLGWIFSRAKASQHTVATGWDDFGELNPDTANYAMQLAGNNSGSVMAVWKHDVSGGTDELRFSLYDPAADQWSTSDIVVSGASNIVALDVAMNINGDAIAVWQDLSIVWASYYDADATVDNWSSPVPLNIEIQPGLFDTGLLPKVAMDDNGNAIAVWDDGVGYGVGDPQGNVWARRYDANNGWLQDATLLDSSNRDATDAQLAMDAAGNAFVIWLQHNSADNPFNDSFEIWARRYDAVNDNWDPEVLVHDPDLRASEFGNYIEGSGLQLFLFLDSPSLAVDLAGNAILVWSENINDEFFVRASRYDISNPGWGPPENISGDAYPFAVFPDIAVDASGNALVVWMAGESAGYSSSDTNHSDMDFSEIWAARYTP